MEQNGAAILCYRCGASSDDEEDDTRARAEHLLPCWTQGGELALLCKF